MRQLLIAISALFLGGCSLKNHSHPAEMQSTSKAVTVSLKNQINKEIDAEVKKWDEAAANKDAESLSNLYAENADVISKLESELERFGWNACSESTEQVVESLEQQWSSTGREGD